MVLIKRLYVSAVYVARLLGCASISVRRLACTCATTFFNRSTSAGSVGIVVQVVAQDDDDDGDERFDLVAASQSARGVVRASQTFASRP